MLGEGNSAGLPEGTVTILVTDIEGSMQRWRSHPDEMPDCVERLDSLLRSSVEGAGGRVARRRGDGLIAVFDDPDRAVAAAVVGQEAIEDSSWGSLPPIRVRMGLHTGLAVPLGSDYVGDAVNRAIRIAESANGGQILVSDATASLVAENEVVELRSLGHHELEDLASPVELVQVGVRGAVQEFPPVRSLEAVTHDLPVQHTSFIGRDDELRALAVELRSSSPLITVVGPGGVGKTRLAIQAAGATAPSFSDGVRFVELAGLERSDDLASVLLDHLPGAAVPVGAEEPRDAVVRRLRGREMLLLIDNCEHQVEECARIIATILDRCPSVTVLTTSRTPLGVTGEHVFTLNPFAVDPHDDVGNDAVRLFLDRAQTAGVNVEDLLAARRVCELVDGLPLAIELAAARAPHLSTAEIAGRLERHTRLLVSRQADARDRHRSLEALLDWSYELLEPIERELICRMSVFLGPVTLDQIESTLTDEVIGAADVLDLTSTLVDRSLVIVHADSEATRYTMLGIVRRFAAARLAEGGRTATWRQRHAEWCLASISSPDDGPEPDERLQNFMQRSSDEVLGALEWTASNNRPKLAWQLVAASWRWWEMRGRAREGLELFTPMVDEGQTIEDPAWAGAIEGVANLSFALGDLERSIRCHRRAIDVFGRQSDVRRAAWCRTSLAMAQLLSGDVGARSTAEQALSSFTEVDDPRGIGHSRAALAMIASRRGDSAAADRLYLDALSVLRIGGHRRDAASVLSNLGNLAQDRGDWRRATRFYDGALELFRALDDRRGEALILNNLSIVTRQRGDLVRAEAIVEEARRAFRSIDDLAGEAACLNNLANLAAERGDAPSALALCRESIEAFKTCADARGVVTGLRNAASLAETWGLAGTAWIWLVDATNLLVRLGMHMDALAELRQLEKLAVEHDAPAMSAIGEALADPDGSGLLTLLVTIRDNGPTDPAPPPAPEVQPIEDLTSRERELLALVGDGLTNGEIAEQLYISRRTVDAHLSHIRAKLGVTDRSKLIVIARTRLGEPAG